ncbi:MAG TPA: hypothetical protein VGM93_03205, partial [Acidimicrobiales bacterium]
VKYDLRGATSTSSTVTGSVPVTRVWKTDPESAGEVNEWDWVTITPPVGSGNGTGNNWGGFVDPGPRALQFTANFSAVVAGDTAGSSADAPFNYWAVPEFDSSNSSSGEDYPAVWETSGTTDTAGTGGALVAGNNMTIHYQCDDNDGGSTDHNDCDSARIRLRNLATDAVLKLTCPSGCEGHTGNNNHVVGNWNADDNTSRTFTVAVPGGIASGLWVIEAGYCNSDGFCPYLGSNYASSIAGYGEASGAGPGDANGGTDWYMLGSFYVN